MSNRFVDPNPQFFDNAGVVLSGGSLTFYDTQTLALIDIYSDANLSTEADNPMALDESGRASEEIFIADGVTYRVRLEDADGNLIWDRDPANVFSSSGGSGSLWAGTATGTANAILLTIAGGPTAYSDGQRITFVAANANTAATTVNVNSIGVANVQNRADACVGGEIRAGRMYDLTFDGTAFQLDENRSTSANQVTVASAATVDFNAARGRVISLTGTTTVTAITLDSGEVAFVSSAGTVPFTHGSSLLLPGGANRTLATGDMAIFVGEAAGVVRCMSIERASVKTALTFATPLLTDAGLGDYFTTTATSSFTLNGPTNAYDGQPLTWKITQDGTGSRVITFEADKFAFPGGTDATLSTTAGAIDTLSGYYDAESGKVFILSQNAWAS